MLNILSKCLLSASRIDGFSHMSQKDDWRLDFKYTHPCNSLIKLKNDEIADIDIGDEKQK